MKLGEYLTAINYTKESLFQTDDETVEKEYTPFVVNRCLSYFIDTILYANEINQRGHLAKSMQFDYLKSSIRKNKRYSKWLKRENEDNLDMIKKYYKYSNIRAREILDILSPEDIEYIKKQSYTGGEQRF
jgi:hypothetical protein